METYAFPALEPPVATPGPQPAPREEVDVDALAEAARAQGYADGLAQAAAELAHARDALLAAVAAVSATSDALERRAVELALALAEKILHARIEVEPELICSVVTGALRRLASNEPVVVEVNPDDAELVRTTVDDSRIDVVAERRVARGGCVIRTAEGELDARLEEQLARAAAVLQQR